MTTADPTPSSEVRRTPAETVIQLGVAGFLVLAALSLALSGHPVRVHEAQLMAPVYDLMTPGDTLVMGDTLFDHVTDGGGPTAVGLRLSLMCSVVVLAVPLLLQAALMIASGRFAIGRVLLGLSASLVIVVVVNTLRIGTIGWARAAWGRAGFELSHHLVAALLALVGFAAAVIVMVRLSVAAEPR